MIIALQKEKKSYNTSIKNYRCINCNKKLFEFVGNAVQAETDDLIRLEIKCKNCKSINKVKIIESLDNSTNTVEFIK